jgi:hypothetical protein
MKTELDRNQPQTSPRRTKETSTRVLTFRYLFIGSLLVACLVGLLSALGLPLGLLLIMIPGASFLIWILVKFFRDNLRLAKWVGWKRLIRGLMMTCLVFIPVFALLIPGFWMGNLIAKQANQGIERLQAWSAPEILSEKIKREIQERVEKDIRRNLPWYYKPLVWTGQVRDYEKIVTNEVRIVTETIQRAQPKPVYIRASAGFLKTLLLFISVYSNVWVALLSLRSLASLFGRIVVASDPPIHFDMRPGRYSETRKSPADFTNSLTVGPSLELSLAPKETLLVRRAYEPTNAVPSACIRLRGGGLLMRIRKRLIFLTKICSEEKPHPIHFHSQGGNCYAAAGLSDGERVVINPSHLVGFSDTVRFFSHYDFSLAMLSMNRAISMVACGPGRLILTVPGDPGIHEKAADAPMIYMDKLILFGMDAKFEVRASKGLIDYYASGCVVRPLKGRLFVCAPGTHPGRNFFGVLWNLIKRVYLPI